MFVVSVSALTDDGNDDDDDADDDDVHAKNHLFPSTQPINFQERNHSKRLWIEQSTAIGLCV